MHLPVLAVLAVRRRLAYRKCQRHRYLQTHIKYCVSASLISEFSQTRQVSTSAPRHVTTTEPIIMLDLRILLSNNAINSRCCFNTSQGALAL